MLNGQCELWDFGRKKKVQCFYKESFITFSLLYESKMNLMKFTTCLSDVLFQTRTTE